MAGYQFEQYISSPLKFTNCLMDEQLPLLAYLEEV